MIEDNEVKIGTPKEKKWTEILKAQEEALIVSEANVEIAQNIIDLCKKKLEDPDIKL